MEMSVEEMMTQADLDPVAKARFELVKAAYESVKCDHCKVGMAKGWALEEENNLPKGVIGSYAMLRIAMEEVAKEETGEHHG